MAAGVLEKPSTLFLYNQTAILATMAVVYMPFVILPIYLALDRIPGTLVAASSDLGARPWTTFRRIVLPLSAPGVVAGALFSYILSLGDYITPQTRLGWIKKKQREFEGQARQPQRLYVSGETHFVFGKPLRLLVQSSAKNRCVIRPDASDRLTMWVPPSSSTDQKARWMATWYRAQLREKVAPRVAKWSDRLGVPIPRWGIRLMKTKWGSCNPEKGLVWLNLDLAKKPLAALDYVILHEMAHFVSPRHDELFLSTLDRNMPGWRQIRSDLNALPLSD